MLAAPTLHKGFAMPLYEYECSTCHRRTEKIQKFSDPELTICPHCGGALERTITAPAFQFAGGGWYKDGYGSAKPATGSNDVPSSDSTSKDSGNKDSSSKDSGSKDQGTSAAPSAAPAPAASSDSAKASAPASKS